MTTKSTNDANDAPAGDGTPLSLEELDIDFSAGSGYYLTAEERDAIRDSGHTFLVTDVVYDEDNEYGPRYVLTIRPVGDNQEGTGRGWAFGAGAKMGPRNSLLARLQAAQKAAGGRPIGPVEFVTAGRTTILRSGVIM